MYCISCREIDKSGEGSEVNGFYHCRNCITEIQRLGIVTASFLLETTPYKKEFSYGTLAEEIRKNYNLNNGRVKAIVEALQVDGQKTFSMTGQSVSF